MRFVLGGSSGAGGSARSGRFVIVGCSGAGGSAPRGQSLLRQQVGYALLPAPSPWVGAGPRRTPGAGRTWLWPRSAQGGARGKRALCRDAATAGARATRALSPLAEGRIGPSAGACAGSVRRRSSTYPGGRGGKE